MVSARSQVELAQNRVSYTRLVADAPGTVAAIGAEPGEVVAAGRMIVQAARKEGRDAVFDVPAQVKDRGFLQSFKDVPGVARDIEIATTGMRLDGRPTGVATPPPRLGEHAREIWGALGVTDDDLDALRKKGVI